MKNVTTFLLALVALSLSACGAGGGTGEKSNSSESEEASSSETPTSVILSVDGGELDETNRTVWMFVEPEITNVPLAGLVNVSPNAKWKLYRGETEIPTKIASTKDGYLLDGDNPFSIVVTSLDGLTENVYGLTIHRSYQATVSYTYQGEILGTDYAYTGYEFELPKEYDVNGYSLSHWLLDGERVTKITPWAEIKVEAVPGEAITYSIQYDLDGGVSNPNPDSYTIEDDPIVLLNPTRDDYVFCGWHDENGNQVSEIDTSAAKDVTLTAKWVYCLKIENGVVTGVNDPNLEKANIPEGVTAIGYKAFYGCSSLASIAIPSSVASIGDEAFYGCSSLTSVTIPSSVASIGYSAFSGCSSLMSITVDEANPKYDSRDGCNAIIETASNELLSGCARTVIPDSVTSIGTYAFYGCSSLTSIVISSSVTSIGVAAFYGCSSLTSIVIPGSVTSIGDSAFSDCSSLASIAIPDSVASIGPSAFYGCSSLMSITVDESNPKYDSRDGCDAIIETASNTLLFGCARTVIPNSVTAIDYFAFYGCSSLASILIPSSVTFIGGGAFYGCSSLASIVIPSSVTFIGGSAFEGCSSLTSIKVDEANPKYDSRDGCDAIIETASNTLLFGCARTIIPDSVTSIGGGAFYGCSSLTSIIIPNSVTSIGDYAFEGCSSLTSVTIPDGVTSIGRSAFYGCSSLAQIFCEASSQPQGWDSRWNLGCYAEVVWGYKG